MFAATRYTVALCGQRACWPVRGWCKFGVLGIGKRYFNSTFFVKKFGSLGVHFNSIFLDFLDWQVLFCACNDLFSSNASFR